MKKCTLGNLKNFKTTNILNKKIIDNHVHVGWYSDGYHAPLEIWSALNQAGIDYAIVSSTSTCAELYHNIHTEFYQLFSIAGKENVCPILWITPAMLLKNWPLKKLLKSKIEWGGIKLHYISHPLWGKTPCLIEEALKVARNLGNVPVLLHTGEWENCHASVFGPVIAANPDLKFVLAHGRPIDETINLMKNQTNIWTDTAFMPIEDIMKLVSMGLTDRVLFGSDMPINMVYYSNLSTKNYLRRRIKEIGEIAPVILTNTIY